MIVTSRTNAWAHACNVSTAGEYRRAGFTLIDGNIATGEDGESSWPVKSCL